MADNVAITAGSGTSIASDDIGGVQFQRIKLIHGADGTNDGDVSSANPLPVEVISGGDGSVQGVDAHDAAVTADPVLMGGYASAAAPTNVSADGDATRIWLLRNGAQCVNLTAAGTLVAAGGGTEATALRVTIATDSTGVLSVDDNGGSLTVDVGTALPAGTNNIGDVDVLTLPGVAGTAAHDAAVSGNPLLNGFEARTADGTAVASGDVVRAMATILGKLITMPFALPANQIQGNLNRTGNTAGDVIAAQAAGVRIAVMSITVINKHATVSTVVTIRDGTTAKIGPLQAAAVNGGWTKTGGGYPLFISTAATAVTAICGTTGADVDISITGYLTTE